MSDDDIAQLRQRTANRQKAMFEELARSGKSVLHRVSDAGAKAQTPLRPAPQSLN